MQGVILTIALICFLLYRIYNPLRIVNKEMKSDKFTDNNINIVYTALTFLFFLYNNPNVKMPKAIDKLPNNNSAILTNSTLA